MERDIGIEGYVTTTRGVGGRIKSTAEDFVVEEVAEPPAPDPDGGYAVANVRVTD